MNSFQFLHHTKIQDGIWHIVESYAPCDDPGFGNGSWFNIYVIEGDDTAAVIDSGLGAADGLRKYIETYITQKPLICLLTHTHPDHVGGAALFDCVYLNSGEKPDLSWNTNIDRRMSDLALFADYDEEVIDFCKDHHVKGVLTNYQLAEDGDRICFGGRELEVIKLPGHSHGSVLYYNDENHFAFGGDCVQILNSYRGDLDALREYHYYLQRLYHRIPDDIQIFSGHDKVIHTRETVGTMLAGLEDVLNGRNLENDYPRPPRFAMTKNGQKTMIHLKGGLRVGYSAAIWGNGGE